MLPTETAGGKKLGPLISSDCTMICMERADLLKPEGVDKSRVHQEWSHQDMC